MANCQYSRHVACLRGIHVERARRVAMADLRKLPGDGVTWRNCASMQKLHVLLGGPAAP